MCSNNINNNCGCGVGVSLSCSTNNTQIRKLIAINKCTGGVEEPNPTGCTSCNCKTDLTQASLVEAKLIQFIKYLCKCEGTITPEPEEPGLPLPTGCSSNTLTTLAFPAYGGYGAPVTAHAKYRINNGAWVNYSVYHAEYTSYSDVFSSFLDSVTHNGARVFEIFGDGFTAWFHCYRGRYEIIGGATQAPYSGMQTTQNDEINPMLIEFEATTEGDDDLVRLAFGAASGSIYSCGLVGWTGL